MNIYVLIVLQLDTQPDTNVNIKKISNKKYFIAKSFELLKVSCDINETKL